MTVGFYDLQEFNNNSIFSVQQYIKELLHNFKVAKLMFVVEPLFTNLLSSYKLCLHLKNHT